MLLFVTGTDTDVGKTVFSAALICVLRELGFKVDALKPLASGCRLAESPRSDEDATLLWRALGGAVPLEKISLYRFQAPLAPTMAARLEGVNVDRELIRETIRRRAESVDWLVVEGAGGLLSPLVDGWTFADLAAELGAAMVVVVASRLGAINQACLTFEVAQGRGIPLVGYILNEPIESPRTEEQLRLLETNRTLLGEVAERYGIRELGSIGFIPDIARVTSFEEIAGLSQIRDTVSRLIESFPG